MNQLKQDNIFLSATLRKNPNTEKSLYTQADYQSTDSIRKLQQQEQAKQSSKKVKKVTVQYKGLQLEQNIQNGFNEFDRTIIQNKMNVLDFKEQEDVPFISPYKQIKKDNNPNNYNNTTTTIKKKQLGVIRSNRIKNGSKFEKFSFKVQNFELYKSQLNRQYNQLNQKLDMVQQIISKNYYEINLNMNVANISFYINKYIQSVIQFKNIQKQKIQQMQQSILKKFMVSYDFINKKINHNLIITQENVVIKKYRNCIYFGKVKNNKKQGYGIVIYFDGKIFQGQFQNDLKFNGLEIKDQQIYFGKFNQALKQDNLGLLLKQKIIYYGSFKKGLWQGHGLIVQPNQIIFDYSKLFNIYLIKNSQNDLYIGGYANQQKVGLGMQKFSNGDFYIGNYQGSKSQGYGQYYWANGAIYKGNFFFGKKHGKGNFSMKQGDSYEGQYMNDKKCGQGRYTWKNGSFYQGQFQNDFRHGYGEMVYPNSVTRKGYWSFGLQINKNTQQLKKKFNHSTQKKSPLRLSDRQQKSLYSKQLFQMKGKSRTLDGDSKKNTPRYGQKPNIYKIGNSLLANITTRKVELSQSFQSTDKRKFRNFQFN